MTDREERIAQVREPGADPQARSSVSMDHLLFLDCPSRVGDQLVLLGLPLEVGQACLEIHTVVGA